jgi:hypothetical protein
VSRECDAVPDERTYGDRESDPAEERDCQKSQHVHASVIGRVTPIL